MEMEARFLQYQQNIFPAMVEKLSGDLGVTVDSINRLGVGFRPGDQSWVWAERDDQGQIIGLIHRGPDGKKWMEKGSKRGLVYECGSIFETSSKNRQRVKFVRAYNVGVDCPLCGKKDWCLVSQDNPQKPSAVICGRVEEGSIRYIENSGYLHMFDSNSKSRNIHNTMLQHSSNPYIVCEGPTDVLAAMDMGYIAVGRPSAQGGIKFLVSLLKGQEVIVVGENDDSVGRLGMHKTWQTLKANTPLCLKVLPPAQYKDLRKWHPTADEFELWVAQNAEKAEAEKILESDDPRYLARRWLEENFQSGESRLLHYCNEDWFKYAGFQYEKAPDKLLDAQLTAFLEQYEFVQHHGNTKECRPFRMTRRFVDDVKFNLRTLCFLDIPDNSYRPFRITGKEFVDTTQAIVFRNGIYHVSSGKFEIVSPDIFTVSSLPYDYWPDAKCPEWETFVDTVFNYDEASIKLLQEWIGYCLVASNYMESMMFLFGGRAAGKSTTIDVLQAVLGPRGYAAIDTADLISRFGLDETVIAKYALIISEDRPVRQTNSAQVLYKIKQITGRDTIPIRRRYKSSISVKPFFKITYVGNEPLYFSDESGSFMRRLNLLFYPNCYEENPDRTLKDRLVKEAPGIALWAIEGLQRLLKNGRFTLPTMSEEHLSDIQRLSSPLQTMISEHCVYDPDAFTPVTELYDLHAAVYKENQTDPLTQQVFGIKIKRVWSAPVERVRRRVAGEQVYGYAGIQIMPAAYRRYLGRPV